MAFEETPIRRRLMAIILGTSGVVLLLTCSVFLAYEYVTFRRSAVQQLSTLGEMVATNSTGVLAFDNQADAADILAALKADHHIVASCLYDRQGALFASYPSGANRAAFPMAPGPDGAHFEAGHLVVFVPVEQVKGHRLGTLYISSDMGAFYDRLRLYGGIALLVVIGSSVVAYVLSRRLQRQISLPILALAETAKAVSDRRDYSVRATGPGGGELGLLTAAFNHMLGQIEEQNRELKKAYDDLRLTQQAVTQQERLRALGQMASGIAHDINNAITPASLYAESLLEREPDLSVRARAYLTTIQRAIDDVAQTVRRLREFYRQREEQSTLAPVDLNQLLQQVVELTRAHWGDSAQQRGVVIELEQALAPDLPAAMGIESEIREALTNLVFNAVDAMPAGGTITVRTSVCAQAGPGPDGGGGTGGRSVVVEVADTGAGMDDETKRRCLEPFFTTKGERGTGLGLAMVYGSMRRHDARIEIESAPGAGTTMRLLFPLVGGAHARAGAAPEAILPRARLRLLVVDDDEVLLLSLVTILRDEGHEVESARGGRAGIEAFLAGRSAGRPFDAVITDLGMPHVDGRQVAREVKAASPRTTVFMLTGWGGGIAAGETPENVDRMLSKPPRLRELREALAAV